ncbi:MAG: glucuronate isomerase [Kiritimatiellae bacterium]|nr:glucuronate isomerase [Kiritimatiellia bacterium]
MATKAKPFINDDFLLDTKAARELYHGYAEPMPIIDYHCHLPPVEIAEDKRWNDIAEVWLGGDHYKWRQMRSNGFEERLCSGRGKDGCASGWEKFEAFAKTMERLVKNPLFDWSHLELARYFGVTERLSAASAKRIYEKCNKKLKEKWFSARGLMKKSNVAVVCTTDDPVDSLEYHLAIAKNPFSTQIRPAWRSDKASKVENLKTWNEWIDKLAAAAKMKIATIDDFRAAMQKRHDFFAAAGCVVSDYGITEIFAAPYKESELKAIFKKARAGKTALTPEEALKFKSAWLYEGLKMDSAANWSAQLHYNCLRDLNSAMYDVMGPDTGFDCIGDWSVTENLAKLFDRLEKEDSLPRTILYSLNPKDNEMLATVMGCFQKAPFRGKIQLGAAWWFLDQKDGMRKQIEALAALGSLGNFVGMLTDSRSFLSYTRHEYFRRLLCQKFGQEIEKGELPNDIKWLGQIVSDISFNNANEYFGFGA